MKRADRAAQVATLATQGLNGIQIAEKLGISRAYAYELLSDPEGIEVRKRKDSYRAPCPQCGTLMDGSNGRSGQPSLCSACSHEDEKANLVKRFARAHNNPKKFRDSELIFALRMAAAGHDSISLDGYRKLRAAVGAIAPSEQTILKRFGSWNQALTAAGLQTNRPFGRGTHYDRLRIGWQPCIDAIRALTDELGRPPTYSEYDARYRQEGWPSTGTIRNYFGSWTAAITETCLDEPAVAA